MNTTTKVYLVKEKTGASIKYIGIFEDFSKVEELKGKGYSYVEVDFHPAKKTDDGEDGEGVVFF